jgi:hypothetical protein
VTGPKVGDERRAGRVGCLMVRKAEAARWVHN